FPLRDFRQRGLTLPSHAWDRRIPPTNTRLRKPQVQSGLAGEAEEQPHRQAGDVGRRARDRRDEEASLAIDVVGARLVHRLAAALSRASRFAAAPASSPRATVSFAPETTTRKRTPSARRMRARRGEAEASTSSSANQPLRKSPMTRATSRLAPSGPFCTSSSA